MLSILPQEQKETLIGLFVYFEIVYACEESVIELRLRYVFHVR